MVRATGGASPTRRATIGVSISRIRQTDAGPAPTALGADGGGENLRHRRFGVAATQGAKAKGAHKKPTTVTI
jgi:hypothetical protein